MKFKILKQNILPLKMSATFKMYVTLLVVCFSLTACLGGSGSKKSGGVNQPPTEPPTPSPIQPFHVVSISPADSSRSISTTQFSGVLTFTNNLSTQSLTVNTGTSADHISLRDNAGVIVPITATVGGNTIQVQLMNPNPGMAGDTQHTLRVNSSITDVYGQTLSQSYTTTFRTEATEPEFDGVIHVMIYHEHDQATYDAAGTMHSFQISFGTESQALAANDGYVPNDANYNAVNNETLVVAPLIPARAYTMTTFEADLFHPFQPGTRYYFVARACSTSNTSGNLMCSDYTRELIKDIP